MHRKAEVENDPGGRVVEVVTAVGHAHNAAATFRAADVGLLIAQVLMQVRAGINAGTVVT